ncbi:MAG: hypothetical protein JXR71_02395 [Bacteroidales bacterium]|nr:hypothetical protein [Bacteroidales bacterium]
MKANIKILPPRSTYGSLSLAFFSFVLLSGILLAIPFNVDKAYTSISELVVMNPWASFTRNLHYWSSQLFLIFSLLHFYDHFHKKSQIGLKKALAFRLALGVLIIFLAMITGFLLKADADSLQARQILFTLTERIPLIGKILAFSLLGKAGSFELIYVHHIATFTIFLTIIIIEHAKRIWPSALDFIIAFLILVTLSYFWSAPLHDNLNPTVKGPWYFVGFQEILHWLSHPEWSILFIALLVLLLYIVNSAKGKAMFFSKRSLLIFSILYGLLTLIGLFFRGENWQWSFPGTKDYNYTVLNNFKTESVDFSPAFTQAEAQKAAVILDRKESCVICHTQTHGFTDAHNPKAIGCFSCHGGNPFATSKAQAHEEMILIPGNLDNSRQSCGTTQCHPNIVDRVPTSLMSTLSGMISVDKYVFGEQKSPNTLTNVNQLTGHSAADVHLKNLCVRCHLGNPKTETGPVTEESRGGGCLACHLNYDAKADSAWKRHQIDQNDTTYLNYHATISLQVTDNHCFGCHSRSARISTSYQGWHETTLTTAEMPRDSIHYRLVEHTRVFKKEPTDVHHTLGLLCIDCHTSYELMGDGKHYAHEENQEVVQCKDCHFSGKPLLTPASKLTDESAIISSLRFGSITGKKYLTTEKRHQALINTWYQNDTAFLITKNTKKVFAMKAPDKECTRDKAHENISCSACHSSWAPTCIGCHNQYDPNEPGYDMLKNKEVKGSWVEYTGSYLAQLPSLGMRIENGKKEVIPVIQGMILSIDLGSFNKKLHDSLLFRRLYAPIAPHTTAKEGRDCKSCHNNPSALGYGSGKLTYVIKGNTGSFVFDPVYENNKNDNLPEDAWIGFMQTRTGMVSTRTNVKPFTIEEQQKILLVGACLSCHKENSKVMKQSLNNFSEVLKHRSSRCILPHWFTPDKSGN